MGREELAAALRETLELDARWGTRPTWTRLGQSIGTDFSQFSVDELQDLLTEVDTPFRRDDPLLSALVRADGGGPLPYLDGVLEAFGMGRPSSVAHLKRWCQREADRALAKYRTPPRTMPPMLPLDASVPDLPTRDRIARTKPAPRKTSPDRRRLQELVGEAGPLASRTPGAAGAHLTAELRTARQWLKDSGHIALNADGRAQTRKTFSRLRQAISQARQAEKAARNPRKGPTRNDKSCLPGSVASTPAESAAAPSVRQDLRSRLIEVARAGGTINWLLLAGSGKTSQKGRGSRLAALEDRSDGDSPLLSSLVVAPQGGPPAYFRSILREVGLAVPRSNEALLMIWRREQERVYAAYADPPRPLPPRIVPKANELDQ
jgi:hypothetical protein